MKLLATACLVTGTLTATLIAAANPEAEKYWPQWRGPHATGVAAHGNPPIEWSETKNIRWKVEIPGPRIVVAVVWGDRMFVLTAVPAGVDGDGAARAARRGHAARRRIGSWCWRSTARTGKIVWERTRERRGAARSLAPRQRHVGVELGDHRRRARHRVVRVARLYAYDMNGTLVWQKDLGDKRMRNEFGEGSTPALHGNTWSSSGITSCRARRSSSRSTSGPARSCGAPKRDEIDTWATPLVVEHNGRAQVIVNGDEPRAQLRSRDRRGRLGSAGHDDEPDSVAGVRRRHGVRRPAASAATT